MKKRNKATDPIYRVTELVGTSTTSWEDAVKNVVETAARTLRDLRVAEVKQMDMKVDGGKIIYRVKLSVSFKFHGDD